MKRSWNIVIFKSAFVLLLPRIMTFFFYELGALGQFQPAPLWNFCYGALLFLLLGGSAWLSVRGESERSLLRMRPLVLAALRLIGVSSTIAQLGVVHSFGVSLKACDMNVGLWISQSADSLVYVGLTLLLALSLLVFPQFWNALIERVGKVADRF